MKTPRLLLVLITAAITGARAQDNPAPAAITAPAQTEMQKWIATTDAQWQAAFKRDVSDVHDAELNKAKLQYLASLETGIAKASSTSDLDGALALRNEQKRFGETNAFPEQDLGAEAASVKQLRAVIRVQLARAEKENAVRVKALHAKYDQVLAQAQAQLTQRQRLDDALLVKKMRGEVAAAWITPSVAAANVPAPTSALPKLTPGGASTANPGPGAAPVLVIISASYGSTAKKRTLDIAKNIRKAMDRGATIIKLNTEEGASGVDPAPFTKKETTVTYTINGQRKKKTFAEGYNLNFKDDLD